MRLLVTLYGLIVGVITVVLVSRYGYNTADTEIDGYISAFLYGAIAVGALAGHAVSVRLWRRSKPWAGIIFVVVACALVVSLSNSLGAIAARGEKTAAQRTKVTDATKDDRAELKRLQDAYANLGRFVPTDAAAVAAAQRAADDAKLAKERECGNGDPKERGPNCRQREIDHNNANTRYTDLSAAKSTTDRSKELEAEITSVRARLAQSQPVERVNPEAAILADLARLARLPDADVDTVKKFAVAAVLELLIVGSFIAQELLRDMQQLQPSRMSRMLNALRTFKDRLTLRIARKAAPVVAPSLSSEPAPNSAKVVSIKPVPVKPSAPSGYGSPKGFIAASLARETGAKIDMRDLCVAYFDWCRANNYAPMPKDKLVPQLYERLEEAQVDVTEPDRLHRVYCVDVSLMGNEARATG